MKPENIFLIEKEGRPDFVKLLDFGIAKVTGVGDDGPRLTRTGMIFGTPEYMAPEQAEGKPADHRVDIYAVGCVIYHCITGVTPFQADSFMAMLTKHLLEDALPPSVRRPDRRIPPSLDALVMRALEKDRDKRWQNMDELMAAVAACEAPTSGPIPGLESTRKLTPGALTQQLGGSGNQPIIRPSARESNTQLVSRRPETDPTDLVSDVAERRPGRAQQTAARGSSAKLALVVAGVAIGVAGAVVWVVRDKGPAASAPALAPPPAEPAPKAPPPQEPLTPAVVAQPPAAGTSPPVAPAGAPGETARPAAAADDGGRKRPGRDKGRPGLRRVVAPDEPGTTPSEPRRPAEPGPSTPAELKPFPTAPK
jgi:serine/threonine-protein kinase